MNRSNRLKNKNSRRFSFSNILAKEVLLERMEDRIVPATITVINTNDSGAGSLRAAIGTAANQAGDDTIKFDNTVFSTDKTITLSSTLSINDASKLTIEGPGTKKLSISGNSSTGIFNVSTNALISNLTLCKGAGAGSYKMLLNQLETGRTAGGAVFNQGGLILDNVSVIDCVAKYGSGIINLGELKIYNSNISNNLAKDQQSGLGGWGGGIFNVSNLTISKSTVSQNTAQMGGGIVNLGLMTVSESSVIKNQAIQLSVGQELAQGGGINISHGVWWKNVDPFKQKTVIINSTIAENSARAMGAIAANTENGFYQANDLYVTSSSIIENSAGSSAGIDDNGNLNLRITNSIICNKSISFGWDITNCDVSKESKNNIIGDYRGSIITNGLNGNKLGNASNPISADLSAIGNYGGSTITALPNAYSPAIHTGDSISSLIVSCPPEASQITTNDVRLFAVTNGSNTLIRLGQEQMIIKAVDLIANKLTVERGVNGTIIASHDAGDQIYLATDQRGYQIYERPNIGSTSRSDIKLIITPDKQTSSYGESVAFSMHVEAATVAAGKPTGTLQLLNGSTLLGSGNIDSNGNVIITTSVLSVGSNVISAIYSGDWKFNSIMCADSFIVNKGSTSSKLTSNASSSIYGDSLTFTTSVTALNSISETPTGTVSFYDGSTLLGSGTVNTSGDASYSTTALAIGTHTITATYAGDTNFNTSTSTAFSQTVVSGVPTSLTISAGNNQTTTVANDFATLLQVRATDSSGNPVPNASVTFTINANGASGSFASSGTVTTNASGYATAPKITANTVAGNFTVTVSATGVSNVVFNLTNTAGAASAIVLTSGNNQNATVNTSFAQALQAKVTDTYGNPIAGIPVTFGVPSTGATGSFAASNIVTTNASGFATAPTLSANTVAGSYQVSTSATGLNTQNFNLTNNSGAASVIAIQDGNNQSATVGAAFVKSLQVLAKDAYGNTVPGLSVTFTEPNTGATGTFASLGSVTTNSVGVATSPAFTANTVSGSYQVVASANGLTSQNFNLTNNAGIATGFAIVAGNNQTVTVGNAFATNLQVKATDTYGNGVPGVSVQFSAPGSGASGSFAGSNLVSSNSQGIAIAPTFTSNTIAGSYTVLASATGLPTQTFTLTNSTSGATIAVTAGNNQSATVGSGFGTALQVKFSDSFGNPVSGVSVTFAAPTIGASGTFNGTATVTSNASGIATAPAFTANGKAGNFTVTVSAANVGSVNLNLTNTAGAASAIVLASGNNQMTTVNTSFGSPLMARVTDVYGNPVQNVSVTFSGPGSGSLAVFGGSTIVSSNADGIVASPTISANTVAGTYTVTASASNVTSAQFTLTNAAGLPTSIVKTGGNNQAIAVNTAFTSPLSVKVSDSYGNPVSNVNIAFSGPSTGSSLAFSGASTVATNALGVATTPAISANSNAGTYSVQAYLNDSVTANFTLTNLAGVASKLVLMAGTNQSTTVNTAFSTSLQVQVTDAFGNPVSNAPVTFTGPASGAGITLTGNQNANSNSSGLASWSAFTANQVAGNYVVVASIAGGSNLNFALSNKAGAAAIATVTAGANQSTVVNTGFGSSLQVKVTDTFGNPVSNVPVTFAAPSSGASASFSGSPSLNTNSDGVVNSPTLTANTLAGTYSVTATVGNVGQSIFSLTNLAGAASAIIKTSGNNQSTVVNTAFSNPLQLKVTDAYGNPVANVPVSFTAPNSGSSLVLGSTTPVSTNAQGIVSSPAITANTIAGNYSVNVTANGNLTDSFSMTNLAGAASAIIKTSGNNQSTVVNTAFSNPLQLKVTDAYGNPVANVPVSFNVPSSGASLVLGSTTPVSTNAQGIATSPVITANTIAGGYSVNVTANGNITDSFTFTNLAGAAAKFTITAGDKQSTTVNTSFASGLKVLVTDTFNNPVTNTPVTFTVPSSGASVVLAGSNVVNTNSTGNATLDGLTANKVAGSFTVLASVPNLQTLNFNLTNNPGAATSLVPVSGNNQSSVINGPFPTALQIRIIDSFGNIIPNVTVAFTSPTTGASAKFTGATSAISDNSGVASISGLIANGVVGSYSVTATATGATNATFALRNAAPTVQSLVVQQGSTGRSFVRYVDLNINDAVTVNTMVSSLSGSAPTIRITNTGLDGKAKTAVVIKGLTKASGNLVKIDFGTNGIGGNAATNVGDGSYLIEMDLDGNGSFESSQRFFRLLGDVNGDKVVDAKDTALVKASLNKSGSNLPADTNGDGKVNASDTSYVAKAQKRKISV